MNINEICQWELGSESSGIALTCVVLACNPDLVPVVGLGPEEEVAMAKAVRARRF